MRISAAWERRHPARPGNEGILPSRGWGASCHRAFFRGLEALGPRGGLEALGPRGGLEALFSRGGLAVVAVLACAWAAPAQAQRDVDLVCPCTVETANLTSIQVTFGVRNFHEVFHSGPLVARLEGRRVDGDSFWERLGTVPLSAVEADSKLDAQEYTAAFRQPSREGTYELRLRLLWNRFWPVDSIYWISEPVEIKIGGGSFSSVYFDGTPTASIVNGSVALKLPAIRNAQGGDRHEQITVSVVSAQSLEYGRGHSELGKHSFNMNLDPGGHIAATEINVLLSSSNDLDYVQLLIEDGDGYALAYQTVDAPHGETLPTRAISTADANILVDSDEDGVSDVNERLMETDPDDAESTPGDSTIDILALYSPGFADLYNGDPTARISHVMTLADAMFGDSGINAELRLVGIAEAEVDESQAFTQVDAETANGLIDLHGADIAIMFRPLAPDIAVCGWAFLGGVKTLGTGVYDYGGERVIHVFGNCSGRTTAHEIGHVMGLGHSYEQGSQGAFRWSRGHGVREQFVTVMAYAQAFGYAPALDVFSSPQGDCEGLPCGVDIDRVDGADAVTTVNATRFQVADFEDAMPDSDEDGFVDPVDAFPDDATEHRDSDGDGTGNNADSDDDNDGVADGGDLFPLDPTEWADTDGDGAGDNADAFPDDRFETADRDGDGVGDNGDLFPNDPTETVDTDNDGVGNNGDAFPFDTREWLDTDGDGVGDNADEDADNDGVADILDPFPKDASRSALSSYRFAVTDGANQSRSLAPAGDADGDGKGDFLIGLTHFDDEGGWNSVAYLVAGADLAAADAADGSTDRIVNLADIAAQPKSWKFVGEDSDDQAGHSVASAGDINGDGRPEVLIGAPLHDAANELSTAGAVYVISAADLAAADAADGDADGVIDLGNIAARDDSWKFIGEAANEQAGSSVGPAGDLNGDGRNDLLVGARWNGGGRGAAYLLSGMELAAADSADGAVDGVIGLGKVAARPGSWKLTGQDETSQVGGTAATPGTDSNGDPGLIVPAEGYKGGTNSLIRAVYLVSAADLAAIDEADGTADGVVELGRAAAAPNSWQIVGQSRRAIYGAVALGDIDGDDVADHLVTSNGSAYFVSGADLASMDENDGTSDGIIRPQGLKGGPNSWEATGFWPSAYPAVAGNFDGDGLSDLALLSQGNAHLLSGVDLAAAGDRPTSRFHEIATLDRSWQAGLTYGAGQGLRAIALAGDVDGDGRDDALMFASNGDAFLVAAVDLRALDRADNRADGGIGLIQLAGDADGDGIGNATDGDDDNDGYPDFQDQFPHDNGEWHDLDDDGVGDNADAFPSDSREQYDTDEDGIGDNADSDDDGDGVADAGDPHPLDTDDDGTDNADDSDDDGDGVEDREDQFPLNPNESVDTDGDGIGNNADSDDDGDGVADASDDLPLDPDESADSDGDGIGDNADAFPNDSSESSDSDGDGTGDNADGDDDNDGVGDGEDAFPMDAAESQDSDGDGTGDNADAFPMDASEQADTDDDGTGDNTDSDDDNDAYTDAADVFPLDPDRTRLFHFRLTGENALAQAGYSVSAGDVDGDGQAEALIGAPGTTTFVLPGFAYGAAYAVSPTDLGDSDRADGEADSTIELGGIAAQASSNAVNGAQAGDSAGQSVAFIGDLDGDGRSEWMVGAPGGERSRGGAYLVSPAGLEAADAIRGLDGNASLANIAGQSGPWVFVGEERGDEAGYRVASAGDVNSDGHSDFLVGAPSHGGGRGAAYLVSGVALGEADSADGDPDGRIALARNSARSGSWKFVGQSSGDQAGLLAGAAGDIDGDGMTDLIIGAPYRSEGHKQQGAIYLIAAADLTAADQADGDTDGVIELANISTQAASWKLLGEASRNYAGLQALTADINGDGELELVVGAPGNDRGAGAVYVLPLTGLQAADDADGTRDRVVDLGRAAALENGWKLAGDSGTSGLFGAGSGAGAALDAPDLDGDGLAELVVGAQDYLKDGRWCSAPGEQSQPGAVYVVSGQDIASADAADGETDGVVRLENVSGQQNSWQIAGEATDRLGSSISSSGDLDGDGRNDLILGAADQFERYGSCGESAGDGLAVVISSADLAAADRRDGAEDGMVDFEALQRFNRSVDFDFDGAENALDSDDDNDGTADTGDAFPLDAAESADNDHDGIGDNADSDDDNDGAHDPDDAFPFDPYETLDSDGDGTGDNADTDDDNDGVADTADAFPLDASESADSDGDGIGDNADPSPDNAAIDTDGDGTGDGDDTDDDGDGVADIDDLFPLDDTRSDVYFFKIEGSARALTDTDFDGDSSGDLVVGTPGNETILVSSVDLDAADSADETVDRTIDFDAIAVPGKSWKLQGTGRDHAFPAGDVDSDGLDDLIVGRLLVSASSLSAEDEAHGEADRVLRLSPASATRQAGIWRLTGSEFDWGVFSLGDLNADGRDDLLIGAPWRIGSSDEDAKSVHVGSGADWQSADALDGADDGYISLDELAARSGSWKIKSEINIALGASISPAGDVNGDGHADLMIGAPEMAYGTNPDSGGVLVLSGAAMHSIDAADGEEDGVIVVTHGAQSGIWKLGGKDFNTGQSVSSAGDVDGDGLDDLIIKAQTGVYLITGATLMATGGEPAATGSKKFAWMRYGLGAGDLDGDGLSDVLVGDAAGLYLISGRDLPELGSAEGLVDLPSVAVPRNSWKLGFVNPIRRFRYTVSSGDLDGDGSPELVLQAQTGEGDSAPQASYLISTAELAVLDSLDGKADRVISLDYISRRWEDN